jgi:hypothetical protein
VKAVIFDPSDEVTLWTFCLLFETELHITDVDFDNQLCSAEWAKVLILDERLVKFGFVGY